MSVNTLLIDGVDYTSYLQRPSLIVDFMSDNRSEAYFSLIMDAATLGTDDGFLVGLDVKIKEDTTVKFGGVIQTINIVKYEPGLGTDKIIKINVTCIDYNEIPSRRVVSVYLEDTTAGGVVTQMISDMNTTGFDDNIGTGTIDTGASFNTYIKNASTVKAILDEVALASGYKWFIDANKDLHFLQDGTIVNAAHDLVETAPTFTDFYVQNLEVSIEDYRNKQWVLGALDSTGAKVNVSAEDSAQISSRATLEGGSGVYGQIINSTQSQNTVDAGIAAENALKVSGVIPYYINFTSYTNDWVAGTKLKCNLPTMGLNSDTYFLIEKVTLIDTGCVFMSEVLATRRNNDNFSTQRTETFVDYFSKVVKSVGVGVEGGISGAPSSGRDYDLVASGDLPITLSTTTTTRSTEIILPVIADLMTTLTFEYTATSAVELTVVYKINAVTGYTFTMDLPIGSNTKTINIPEIEYPVGTFDIDFLFTTDIDSALQIDNYLMRTRWEQYVLPYTDTIEAFKYQLLSEIEVSTATTSIDFTSLNLDVSDEILLVSDIKSLSGAGSPQYFIYVNGNTTDTNYYSQGIYAASTTIAAFRSNSPLYSYGPQGRYSLAYLKIKMIESGYFTCSSSGLKEYIVSGHQIENYNINSTFTITNINQLRIGSSVTNGIDAGSKFWLYKINKEV